MGMLPLKVTLLSTGVVSLALLLKLSLPSILDFLTYQLPLVWSLALSWLQPPYLYLLINCIIISIVASSKLQPRVNVEAQTLNAPQDSFSVSEKVTGPIVEDVVAEVVDDDVVVFGYVESPVVVKSHHIVTPVKEDGESYIVTPFKERESSVDVDDGEEFVLSKVALNSPESFTPPYSPVAFAEKPPFSSRFGHRRAVKASPEGKTKLRVTKPKKQETFESTWRTITDGRSMPLTRHLKKSDTFGTASPETSSPVRVMKKSDTFSGGGGNSSPASGGSSGGRLRREPSLSQDELNRRVEAFIKKFNEEMRLQRQESLKQYNQMVVGRGSH